MLLPLQELGLDVELQVVAGRKSFKFTHPDDEQSIRRALLELGVQVGLIQKLAGKVAWGSVSGLAWLLHLVGHLHFCC